MKGPAVRRAGYALLAIAVGLVFLPVLLHPSEVLYSPRSDLLSFIHPYRALQNATLAEFGRMTLFDPTSFAGVPLAGDPQAALFYPPNWLHFLDYGGEGEAFHGWLVVLHLLVGGWGMIWWLGPARFSTAARVAAALVLVLSGKWIYHVIVQGHMAFLPVMWVPWQCGLVERLAERPDARRGAALAVMTALVLLGAQPQIVLYSQIIVAVWTLFVVFRPTEVSPPAARSQFFAVVGMAVMVAFGLASVSLWPMIADLDLWVRGEGLVYAMAAERALTPAQLLDFVWPAAAPQVHEPVPWAGWLALPLALFGLTSKRSGRLALFVIVGMLLMAWYSLGALGGLHGLLYTVVPGFDLFRIPPRVFLLLGPLLGLGVAVGIEALGQERGDRRADLMACALALLGCLGATYVGWAKAWPLALGWSLPAMIVWTPWPRPLRLALPWLVCALLFLDHARAIAPLIETRSLEDALGDNPVAERLAAPFGEGRVLAFNWRARADLSVLPATYTTRAGLESLRGFNPLIPRATWEYLQRGVARGEPEPRPGVTIRTFSIESRRHLDLLNVRWVVTNAPLQLEGLALRETFEAIRVFHYQLPDAFTTLRQSFVYENLERMPRAALVRSARHVASQRDAIEAIRDLDPRREVLVEDERLVARYPGDFEPVAVQHRADAILLELDAGEGGYLLLSELWYPGWRALVDGEPVEIHRANAIFQVLKLASGRHRIELEYRPGAYVWGLRISAVSLMAVLAALWVSRSRARPVVTSDESPPGVRRKQASPGSTFL